MKAGGNRGLPALCIFMLLSRYLFQAGVSYLLKVPSRTAYRHKAANYRPANNSCRSCSFTLSPRTAIVRTDRDEYIIKMLQKAAEDRHQLLKISAEDIGKTQICGGFLAAVGTIFAVFPPVRKVGFSLAVVGVAVTAGSFYADFIVEETRATDIARLKKLKNKAFIVTSRLREAADHLDTFHRNLRKARLFGSFKAFASGIFTAISSLFSFKSGGHSLPVAAIEWMLDGTDGVFRTGTPLTDKITHKVEALQAEWEDFVQTVLEECEILYSMQHTLYARNLREHVFHFLERLQLFKSSVGGKKDVITTEVARRSSKFRGLTELAEFEASALIHYDSPIMIPFNFIEMVIAAFDLAFGGQLEATRTLTTRANIAERVGYLLIRIIEMFERRTV